MRNPAHLLVLVVSTALITSAPGSAGTFQQRADPPFSNGDHAQYRASWGILGRVGTGTLEVPALDTVHGRPALRILLTIRGGLPGARVDERIESWLDEQSHYTHRYVQRTRYPRFARDRERLFLPAEMGWTGQTNGIPETGELPTDRPLDELGFLFHIRTLDLEVGREYVFDRYWNAAGNPVRLKVLRRQTVSVPAGRYSTVVLQPIIRTSSLFAEGAEAEVYIADGPDREIVMLRAKLSIGTLTLRLERQTTGGTTPTLSGQ